MQDGPIVGCALVLLVLLMYLERERNPGTLVPVKFLLSLLFVITAVVQPHPYLHYYYFLLGGMILCLGGDVLLALPSGAMFLYGLISFLFGHIMYICAFLFLAKMTAGVWIVAIFVCVIGGIVYVWLLPRLGQMKYPVFFYSVVIGVMLIAACSVMGNRALPASGRTMVLGGALSFYVSDIFVARDRFVAKAFINRVFGLPLYYAGQFLLAFSVGMVK